MTLSSAVGEVVGDAIGVSIDNASGLSVSEVAGFDVSELFAQTVGLDDVYDGTPECSDWNRTFQALLA